MSQPMFRLRGLGGRRRAVPPLRQLRAHLLLNIARQHPQPLRALRLDWWPHSLGRLAMPANRAVVELDADAAVRERFLEGGIIEHPGQLHPRDNMAGLHEGDKLSPALSEHLRLVGRRVGAVGDEQYLVECIEVWLPGGCMDRQFATVRRW